MKTARELAKEIREQKLDKKEAVKLVSLIMMNYDVMIEDLGLPVHEIEKALETRKQELEGGF